MYTMNFDLAALILSLFCLAYSLGARNRQYIFPKGLKNKLLDQHFVFMMLLFVSIISAAASVSQTDLANHPEQANYGVLLFHNEVFFISHTMLAGWLTLYFMNVNGSIIGRKRSFYLFFLLPFLCGEFLTLLNPITKWVFYLDSDLVYHRGPLLPFLYGLAFVYIVIGFVFFFRYRKAISRIDSFVVLIVVTLAVFGVAVQAIRPDLLVELFFESIAILTLMIVLEDHTGSIDVETRVLNRRAFNDASLKLMGSYQSFSLIPVKIINFDFILRLFTSRDMGRLMKNVAEWLEEFNGGGDVYRYWHEGFTLIVKDKDQEKLEAMAKQILERFEEVWEVDEVAAKLEVMVGMIKVPEDVRDITMLQDILVNGFLQTEKPGSILMTRDMVSDLKRTLAIEDTMRTAIEEGRFSVWYQPIWSAESGRIVAAEALARLRSDDMGNILPSEFIPIAEKSGVIHELGRFIFEETCCFIHQYDLRSMGIEYIDVNLSLYQLLRNDLLSSFEEIRKSYGVDAKQINLEITEGYSYSEVASVRSLIEEIIKAGYSLSMDDFGTGFSNLERLIEKRYMNIKVDKSILWGGENDSQTAKMLDDLIRVIRGMGMNVVQEGVETKAQLDRVVASGANLIQGFYFSKPLPRKEFIEYLVKMNGPA